MLSRLTFTAMTFRSVPVRVAPGAVLFSATLIVTLGSGILPAAAPGSHPAAYWAVAVLGAAIFAGSLLAHELAHTSAALRAGVGVDEVKLVFLGGMARLSENPSRASDELRIAIAGPAASAALAALFVAGALPLGDPTASVPAAVFAWSAAMNLVIAAFNMLPFAPLDGGRVLAALLWRRSGDRFAARLMTARIGVGVGAAALVAAGVPPVLSASMKYPVLWVGSVGLFILVASTAELSVYRVASSVQGVSAGDAARASGELDDATLPVVLSTAQLSEVVLSSDADRVAVVDPDGNRLGAVDVAAVRAAALNSSRVKFIAKR